MHRIYFIVLSFAKRFRLQDNVNFAFHIDGFYCNASIAGNRFQGNKCRIGCVTLSGTEKQAEVIENEFVENYGRYIVELHMNSHTPYTQWVEASVSYNNFKRNSRPPDSPAIATSSPTSYALGIRGLQNVTINRNLFLNPQMDFELLGGQASSLLENYLDATENYWGTGEQPEIVARIFDFDDWNSFAIVEYFPFLVSDRYNSRKYIGTKWRPIFDMSGPIGGRITENLRLKPRSQPYIVSRDLTVMSGVSLMIEAGTELQFYPNIGILVLGSLVALGTKDNPVRFSPVPISQYATPSRKSRAANPNPRIHHPDLNPHFGYKLRLSGGSSADDGYIEIYNETEHRWSIVCDDGFNDMTAQVACRTMGKESSNVIVRRNPYYDIFVFGYPLMHEQVTVCLAIRVPLIFDNVA